MHVCDRQTDRQTDRRTEFSSLDRVCIPCSAVKMIWSDFCHDIWHEYYEIQIDGWMEKFSNIHRTFQ